MEEKSGDSILTAAEAIAMMIKATSGNRITFDKNEADFLEFAFLYFSEHPEVMDALQEFVRANMEGEIQPVNIQ